MFGITGVAFITFCAWLWFVDWMIALLGIPAPSSKIIKWIALIVGLLVLFSVVLIGSRTIKF